MPFNGRNNPSGGYPQGVPGYSQPQNSGQFPPVQSPSQSGQFAPVQGYGQTSGADASAGMTPGPAYGTQPPTQPQRPKGGSKLLKVGIVSCIVAVAVLLITLVLVFVKPFGLFEEKLRVEKPSSSQVQAAFESATIPSPDIQEFAFVDDTNLQMRSIGDYNAGAVQYTKEGGSTQAYCDATAQATYENPAISIVQDLSLRMDYDKAIGQWTAGAIRSTSTKGTPESAAKIENIAQEFANILKAYDSKIAALYAGSEISTSASLGVKGGTASFTLTKKKDDGSSITCTANTEITWNDTSGWVVKITSISGDTAEEAPAPASSSSSSSAESSAASATPAPAPSSSSSSAGSSTGGGTSGGSGTGTGGNAGGDGASFYLECYTGELVEIPGTIIFDNTGKVLLRTDAIIRVVLDGRVYTVSYFEIKVKGSFSGVNGQHLVMLGYISASGTSSQTPLAIEPY